MNWGYTMSDTAEPAPTRLVSMDAAVAPREPPTSWEPHDVWLNRIKLPRDLAAMRRAEAPAAQ
jgi:hypothetical protein